MKDNRGREIDYLRISVTDRCNLRCRYCMPEEGCECFTHQEMMTLEELALVSACMAGLGVRRIRLTGGEPLVRKNLVWLIGEIHKIPGIEEITMTSNGILLADMAAGLKAAGLSGVNVSLDTLDRQRFLDITRRDEFGQVMKGIQAARAAGLQVKINCAVLEPLPLADLRAFAEFSVQQQIPVRFIEMMPIGEGCSFSTTDNDQILKRLTELYADVTVLTQKIGNGPAVYYGFADGRGRIGFISAVHHRFCDSCNRVRLTSDGYLKLCLAGGEGISLRDAMRGGMEAEALTGLIRQTILQKPEGHHFAQNFPPSAGEGESPLAEQIQGKKNTVNMNRIGG